MGNTAIDFRALLRPADFRQGHVNGQLEEDYEKKQWLCYSWNSMLYFNIPNVLFCKEALFRSCDHDFFPAGVSIRSD
jgi:hypothetical protein